MSKIYEVFEHDIKRKFDDVMTVEDSDAIKAIDIDEYVLTKNVEDIIGNIVAYFFDDNKDFPQLQQTAQELQNTYRERIGPGGWIRGFFGSGKSHLLKVIYTMFTKKMIPYTDENGIAKELNVIQSLIRSVRQPEIALLLNKITPSDYITFIFSANHIAKSGDTVIDCLPKEISRQLEIDYEETKRYSAFDVAEFLKKILKDSGKKRMIIFIDEILDLLDQADKVRKFEGLIELLPDNIWMIVTSLEAKSKLLDAYSAERMIHRFGEEQLLYSEEMVDIVKERYLAKSDKAEEIEHTLNIDKLRYIFHGALLSDTQDGKITMPNLISSYPFYPFQLAYLKEMLKNEGKGSARNLMKTVKAIVKKPEVYNQEIGYFVKTDLIYDELNSKRSIEDESDRLITALQDNQIADARQLNVEDKSELLTVLKAVVLLCQIKPQGVKDSMLFPFVYSENDINSKEHLLDILELLVQDNYLMNEGGWYRPITKKESEVWTKIKDITCITETAIREKAYESIYRILGAGVCKGKHVIKVKMNEIPKTIAFVLKKSDESNELPNVYSCIPFEEEIKVKQTEAFAASNDRNRLYLIPEKKYDGDRLYRLIQFYLQMEEALDHESEFEIDTKLRIQIETKRDTEIAGEMENILADCFQNAVISYNGQDNKDVSQKPSKRLIIECEKMLRKRYSMFFGKKLKEPLDKFITNVILNNPNHMSSDFLRGLELLDANGSVNTANRYYNEFIKTFPSDGARKDGSTVMEDFTQGKYGWEPDMIKIMTALALCNGDLKITYEGHPCKLPEDAEVLTGKNGPFSARKRDGYDACQLARRDDISCSLYESEKVIYEEKRLSDYTESVMIQLEHESQLVELDIVFEQVKKNIAKDMKEGKKITLRL